MKNKRAISLVLCASLVGSPIVLSAETAPEKVFKYQLNGFKNVTAPSSSSSADGAGYYGGNISYSFNNSLQASEPWADFDSPGISAGCNGFSINGGFANFMDLGKIADQLASAGGALAWGLLVGLVNSMPTLEHIFSKIKGWIQWMQDLVRNACNIGSQLSKSFVESTGIPSTVQKALDKPGDLIDEGVGKAAEKVKKALTGASSGPVDEKKEEVAKAYGKGFDYLFFVRGAAGKFLYDDFIKPELTAFGGIGREKNASAAENMNFDYTIIDGTGNGGVDKERSLKFLLFVNIFGDEGVSPAYIKFVEANGSIITDLMAKGETKSKAEKKGTVAKTTQDQALEELSKDDANALQNAANGSPGKFKKIAEPKEIPSPNVAASFVNTLINGSNKGNGYDSKDEKSVAHKDHGKLKLYPMKVIHAQVRDAQGETHDLISSVGFEKEPVAIQWDGLYLESKYLIECELGKKDHCGDDKKSLGLSLMIPNSEKIFKTIAYQNSLEKESGLTGSSYFGPITDNLISIAARMNAFEFGRYMLKDIMDKRQKAGAGNKGAEGEKREAEIEKILKNYLNEIGDSTYYQFKTSQEFKEFFDKVEKDQQLQRNKK